MSTPLAEVPFFDYLGLRLDERVSMQPAMESILGKARKGGSQVAAVAYSLRYDKHHHNPSVDDSVQKILQLWRSLVLPHFLQYLRYIPDEKQLKTLQTALNSSLSGSLHAYGHSEALQY